MADRESDREQIQLSWREQIVKLREQFRYLEGNLKKLEVTVNGTLNEQDKRIRILENFRWWMVGAMIGSGLISAIANVALRKLLGGS